MNKNSKKANPRRVKEKILSLAAGAMLLSGQAAPVALAAQQGGSGLMSIASVQDIQTLAGCMAENGNTFVARNLISKGFSLTNYEMLVISEIIRKDLESKPAGSAEREEALDRVAELQRRYSSEYQLIFSHLPAEVKHEAETAVQTKAKANLDGLSAPFVNSDGKTSAEAAAESKSNESPSGFAGNSAGSPAGAYASLEDLNNTPVSMPSMTMESIKEMAAQYGIKVNENFGQNDADSMPSAVRDGIASAGSASELADAMSLINIRRSPYTESDGEYEYTNPENPVRELTKEALDLGTPDLQSGIEDAGRQYKIQSIQDIIDAAADIEDKKAKHFFLTVAHSIYYMDSGNKGATVLDSSVRDDNGNLYQEAYPEEHELTETLEIGLGIRVHKAMDMIVSMVAENENGLLSKDGTSWDFGNVLFKFHPERLGKAGQQISQLGLDGLNPKDIKNLGANSIERLKSEGINSLKSKGRDILEEYKNEGLKKLEKYKYEGIQKLNSEGIIIRDGGKVVGKRIGHGSSITTNTETGDTTLQMGNSRLSYDREDGFNFTDEDGRYYIGFGKLSLNLSTYTLQLSDCKAVQVGYHDNDQKLLFLYGRSDGDNDSLDVDSSSVSEETQRDIFAAQYVTKKLLPNVDLTFNFAKSKDRDSAWKNDDTAYSLMFKGQNKRTSYEGEFAHIINQSTDPSTGKKLRDSANADYIDMTHQFNADLNATLHLINVDGNYNADSLVEDKTGEHLRTTTKGDGTPDYLYQPGQRGLDLDFNWSIDRTASMAFGLSKYTETEEGNSKTNLYLSGNKQWSLGDDGSLGTLSLQQRFERNKVSNRTYTNNISDTTLSYSGSPWKDGTVSADAQRVIDNKDGNETRFDFTASHDFKPAERVTITPKFEFERKKGDPGEESKDIMDTTTIVNSLTIGYELIPNELTVNLLVSHERYKVISSEIDEATGKKIDGENRTTRGTGLGLVWEPSKIAGLSLGVSYRRDKVDYIDRRDNSNQDVWEYSIEYNRPITDKIRASISYDYKSAKDKVKPIYDDVTRTVSIDIDARIGKHTSLQLQHSYESEYKPLDSAANSTTHETVLQMVNRF